MLSYSVANCLTNVGNTSLFVTTAIRGVGRPVSCAAEIGCAGNGKEGHSNVVGQQLDCVCVRVCVCVCSYSKYRYSIVNRGGKTISLTGEVM